jgi:hypothetical protein
LKVLDPKSLTFDIYDPVFDILADRLRSNNSIRPLGKKKLVFDEPKKRDRKGCRDEDDRDSILKKIIHVFHDPPKVFFENNRVNLVDIEPYRTIASR